MRHFQPDITRRGGWKPLALAVLLAGSAWGCSDRLPTGPQPGAGPRPYTMPYAYNSGRTIELRSRVGRDRCLDVAGASREAGARVIIGECVSGAQQAFFWDPGNNAIRVYDGTPEVKCLDDGGGQLQAGDPVIIWHCHGGAPQRWVPTPDESGIQLQGTGLCLDVLNNDPTPGNVLIVWHCDPGQRAQRWDAVVVGTPVPGDLQGVHGGQRAVELRSRVADNRCMDVAGASREAGARVTIWECVDGPQQTFFWDPGTNEIRVYDGTSDAKCVDDGGGHLAAGDPVIIWHCNGGAPQRWVPTADGSGIQLQGTGLCLDVPNGDPALGTGLIVWYCHGGTMQQWFRGAGVLYARMDGQQPTPNFTGDPDGSGEARFYLPNGGRLVCATTTVFRVANDSIIDSHIHIAPRGLGSPAEMAHWGRGGSLVEGLRASAAGRECVDVGAAGVRRLLEDPDGFYYNLHTPQSTVQDGGILRGQLSSRP